MRTYETIEQGKPTTPFMRDGDVVRIEMFDRQGASVFGTIENRVAWRLNRTPPEAAQGRASIPDPIHQAVGMPAARPHPTGERHHEQEDPHRHRLAAPA